VSGSGPGRPRPDRRAPPEGGPGRRGQRVVARCLSRFRGSTPPPSNSNLAQGQPATSSGYTQTYSPGNAVDNNTGTYWESTDNAFPQWLQADLGSATKVGQLHLQPVLR
jgi:F5/8 type C domain